MLVTWACARLAAHLHEHAAAARPGGNAVGQPAVRGPREPGLCASASGEELAAASDPSERWKWDFMFPGPAAREVQGDAVATSFQGLPVNYENRVTRSALAGGVLAADCRVAGAQTAPPPAQLTPLLEREIATATTSVRVAMRVTLAEGLHANSNKPRDPNLIPLVLRGDPSGGITVDEVVYSRGDGTQTRGSRRAAARLRT